jgi:serine/threonine-protein kinase PpkA
MEVIYKHRRAPLPVLPAEFEAYQALVHKLLAKTPADRFQSARELLEATATVTAGVPQTGAAAPAAGVLPTAATAPAAGVPPTGDVMPEAGA